MPPTFPPGPPRPKEKMSAPSTKKGAPLFEPRLEVGQVDDSGVHLHLSEIRIDRAVERQVRGEPVGQVHPGAPDIVGSGRVGLDAVPVRARFSPDELRLTRHVGEKFEAPPGIDPADPLEVPVPGHAALLELGV